MMIVARRTCRKQGTRFFDPALDDFPDFSAMNLYVAVTDHE
jgi:hypothetical protein